MMSFHAFAAFETLTVTHSKISNLRKVQSGVFGNVEIVGNFDRIVDGRNVSSALFQYRIGESGWTTITANRTGVKVWNVSATANYRKFGFGEMVTTSFELRACQEQICSVPYIVTLVPEFVRIMEPSNHIVTPFRKNISFLILRHLGPLKFHIGQLDSYPGSSEIFYNGKEEVEAVRPCPQSSPYDPSQCEITVPDSLIKNPGQYALTAVDEVGNSINFLKFEIVSVFKILETVPARIQSQLQNVFSLHFAGEQISPGQVKVAMVTPCPMRIPVTGNGRDRIFVKIPPRCMPQSGSGDLWFVIQTPEGFQRLRMPYEL